MLDQPGVFQNHWSRGRVNEEKTNLFSTIAREGEGDEIGGMSNPIEKGVLAEIGLANGTGRTPERPESFKADTC